MTVAIIRPHPNCNPINNNTNPILNANANPNPHPINTMTNLNPNPKNPNHNHTPRTENSLEQIQQSFPGDR